jgi:hypothetical protein
MIGSWAKSMALMCGLFRTQLFNPVDLKNVHQIQDAYQVRPTGWIPRKAGTS